ncbi:MAG TPA: ATP-binding protein [Candidatus Saccharimonadia bacterium]|nr:ATP-binding protein [Candidatus Saccharimonadia bacterium]
MATFFLLFNREFTKIKLGPDWLILLVGGLMALVALKPGVLASSIAADRSIVTTPGIAVMAILLVGFLSWGLLLLVASLRRARGLVRTQLQFMLAGMTTAALMGVLFNLALPVMGHIYTYVYLGPDFTTFYVAAIAYSVIRQRLFNLRVAIARTIAYLLVLTAMAGMYIAAILSITSYFLPSGRISGSQNLISTVVAIVLVFTFQPLRRFFERVTDSVFYRDRYDSQVVLNEFSKVLVSELDLDRILRRSLSQLCRDVHIQFGQLVIFNQDRVYRVEHFGPLPKRLMVAPELRRLDESLLVADELEAGERKTIMDEHAVRVSVRLATRDEFVGYLLLGDKLSGDIYSNQDIELLEIIGKELAVAILNAKAYAEIEAFNRTLQERVDHATNRLRVANRHLKELDKAKDEFISMASHQLRTPLTTIKGYLSMMLEGDAGRLTAAQKQFAGYAFSSSERMVNLISDLLNVSRLSAGRFLIQTKPTDMVAMVADEVRQLQSHAAAKHISLIFEQPPADFPLVEIDENKTRQVIMNFIDNAIYYTQTGSVRVRLTLAGPIVRLEVIDTGIGVPAAEKRHLFTKFYRAENAQVVRPDGTGLGLYLAKRVVEDQDGTILFSSTEGKGSVFGFELPIKPRHKSAPKSANDKQKENQHG